MPASLDNGLELFANWQTIVVGLTIYVVTAAIRRVVETAWKGAKDSKWWYEVFLPLGPIANGVILALSMRKFPWPDQVAGSTSARVTYAIVCGLFCGWLYARVRGFFRSQAGDGAATTTGPELSIPPPVEVVPPVEVSTEESKATPEAPSNERKA